MIGSLGRVTRLDGIAFGAGPAFLLRELVLFQADFRRTDWFQCGGPAPRADPPSGATFDWVSPAEWEVRADAMATAPAVAAQRFQGGGARCLVGMTEGQVIYHLWISEAEEYIDWIFHPIAPPAGHVLVFDVWVHPDHRGGNVHWAGAAEACAEAVRRHRPVIFAGILTIDIVVFAKAKAI